MKKVETDIGTVIKVDVELILIIEGKEFHRIEALVNTDSLANLIKDTTLPILSVEFIDIMKEKTINLAERVNSGDYRNKQ